MAYKVALVLDDTIDTTDGVQQYILGLGRWLTAQGHDVHYVVGQSQRTDIANVHSLARNVKVRFNKNRASVPLPVPMSRVRKLLAEQAFDIIHVQVPYSPFMAGRVVRAASPKTAVVGTFHVAPHSRIVQLANGALRFIVWPSLRRFDTIISVSETAQAFARGTYGITSAIIPNAIDLNQFHGATPIQKYVDGTNIVFFGRLVERKGCRQLLKAINYLHKNGTLPKDVRMLVCGTGPQEAALKDYVRRNDLEALVTFIGFVEEADKAKYLACGDIIVYPSTGGESFGIVLLEGMAAGRGMVLAGNNPGYASVLIDHPDVLFDPNDKVTFADKLIQTLENPAFRAATAKWQKQFVKRFDISQVGKEIVAVYATALHKHRV